MLQGIFYTRFHPGRGRSVIHQYPHSSVISSYGSGNQPLVNFSDISAYIIPSYELCDRPLSISSNGYRVMGFPISLEDGKYDRNRFTFNVCFVLEDDEDIRPWQPVVSKVAAFFSALEKEDGLLQAEEQLAGLKWAGDKNYPAENIGAISTLLETILDDLNAYGETCIHIDDLHVLNLRLDQPRSAPPKVWPWDVPLLIRPLPSREEWAWDLTLQRIHTHIDGVHHVQRIAELADVELKLVKRAIRELVYHDRVMLLDIFHFQAIYAPTADLAWFVKDEEMLDECCKYVAVDPSGTFPTSGRQESERATATVTKADLINLYTSLSPGVSVQAFVLSQESGLSNIDIRRFITFGVIKGFLRRIHKYALATDTPPSSALGAANSSPTKSKPKSNEDVVKQFDRAWKMAALSSGWATPPTEPPDIAELSRSNRSADELRSEEDEKLRSYFDGKHCMNEICVEMRMSESSLAERARNGKFGEVVLFNK